MSLGGYLTKIIMSWGGGVMLYVYVFRGPLLLVLNLSWGVF